MGWLLVAAVCLDALCGEAVAANSVTGPVVFQSAAACHAQVARFTGLLAMQMAYEGEVWEIQSIECRPNGEMM